MLGCRGWGRADVIVRADGSYSFLEMNTSPGMTGPQPRADRGARRRGCRTRDLCVRILEMASLESGNTS